MNQTTQQDHCTLTVSVGGGHGCTLPVSVGVTAAPSHECWGHHCTLPVSVGVTAAASCCSLIGACVSTQFPAAGALQKVVGPLGSLDGGRESLRMDLKF